MAKQQNNDENLFDNFNIEGFESELLVVDNPDSSALEDELEDRKGDNKKDKSGSGDPGRVKKPGDEDPGKGKPDHTFIVDKGSDDEPGDDDKKNAGNNNEKDKKGGGTPEEENESPVYLHAAALQEQGVLPNFDLKSLADLEPEAAILKINEHIQTQIDASIQEGVEEYKSTLGEKAKEFIESLEEGVPFEAMADNYTLEERYGSIDAKGLESDEDLQAQIYSDFLTLKGFSDPKIKKMVDMSREKETLLEDSVDGLKEIQVTIAAEREELRKAAVQEKKDREARAAKTSETIQATVKATKEIFPGVDVTEDEKKELIKMLTVPVQFTNKEGKKVPMSAAMAVRAKDPIAFELKLAYFVKNGFFDEKVKDGTFNVFSKKVETSATKRLAEIMNSEKKGSSKPVSEVDKEKNKQEKDDFVFPQMLVNR